MGARPSGKPAAPSGAAGRLLGPEKCPIQDQENP
jgi:hypothetical protein